MAESKPRTVSQNPLRSITPAFLIAGLFFIGFAAVSALFTASRLKGTQTARGVIIEIERRDDPDVRYLYYPRAAYVTALGEKRVHAETLGSRRPPFKIGQAVTIRYSPGSDYSVIDRFRYTWMRALFPLAAGLFFIILGAGFRFRSRNQSGPSDSAP